MAEKGMKRRVLAIGDTVLGGKYEILKVIHTSGMANVYLVEDNNLNKQWCLKEIIKSTSGKNMVEYQSLIREANIMKRLSHSSIPRIVTIEDDDDSTFIVMDYVDGLSVKEWLIKKGTVDQKVAVSWIKQVCGVMIYLHNRKNPIFYRDMKPDNIMIQSDGNIKVVDFGISEIITEKNKVIKEALGTKGFAAPEQKKKGLPYDLRSDIFGIGRTLYYMLTGLNPSVLGNDLTPVREINPSISVGLEIIVNKCMEFDLADRYQNVEELLYDLQNYNKLDIQYRKKLKKKVTIVKVLFSCSVLLLVTSLIPMVLNRNLKSKEYQNLLNIAVKSGKEEDFISALKENPRDVNGYELYIDSIKADGVFTKEEEVNILNLLNPELSQIKSQSGYGDLAYTLGRLYWFYYDGDVDTNMSLGTRWFEDAIEYNSNVEESSVFYNIGNFKKNIAMSLAEATDSGMYKDYWDKLMESKEYVSGEIMEVQINKAIVEAITSYAYRLKVDGIDEKDISKELDRISNYIDEYTPSSDKAKILFEGLKRDINGAQEIIDRVYGGDE